MTLSPSKFKSKTLCSNHFPTDAYLTENGKRLCPNAVPTSWEGLDTSPELAVSSHVRTYPRSAFAADPPSPPRSPPSTPQRGHVRQMVSMPLTPSPRRKTEEEILLVKENASLRQENIRLKRMMRRANIRNSQMTKSSQLGEKVSIFFNN